MERKTTEIVKQKLAEYRRIEVKIKNIDEEISIERELAKPSVQAVAFGEKVGHGHSELNPVEKAADRRVKASEKIRRLQGEKGIAATRLRQIDNALDALAETEKQIVTLHYIRRSSWANVARKVYISERRVKTKAYKALKKLAEMLP